MKQQACRRAAKAAAAWVPAAGWARAEAAEARGQLRSRQAALASLSERTVTASTGEKQQVGAPQALSRSGVVHPLWVPALPEGAESAREAAAAGL